MTTEEACYWLVCFVPPIKNDIPRIFGFAEFISALALLVIIYTLVDVRYRFRISIAPTPLRGRTFAVIGLIGGSTLLTEIWLAQGWWVPNTIFLSQAIWQGIFAFLFLGTFMTWVWYAYIRPPVFGKRNSLRFAQALYRIIVKGVDSELAVISDELSRSAKSLVAFAPSIPRHLAREDATDAAQPAEVSGYAYDVLRLIGNRKFCRHIIQSAPTTAILLFEEASQAKKFHLPLGTFSKNMSAEAISNRDSNLYHESDEFSSGLIGQIKPFSLAIYGDYSLVEGLGERFGSPLDIDYREYWEWEASQWEVFCDATRITLIAYLNVTHGGRHSSTISRAFGTIEHAFQDTYKLADIPTDYYSTDIYRRLEVVVEFLKDIVAEIDEQEKPPVLYRLRKRENYHMRDIYDLLANLMFEVVLAASAISGPQDKAWGIHYNAVWGRFFDLSTDSRTWKILHFKLRRLLYNEIIEMDGLPNYKGARILGYCLNVMGLKVRADNHGREYRALAKVIQAWAQRSYLNMRKQLPDVADAVLIGGIAYDVQNNRLVKTYAKGLRAEPPQDYLLLISN
jgi:hypothetical protein